MELKSSINLPKTAFPMKANLPQNEPKMLERWEQMGLYGRIRQARKGKKKYILHDGPPYTSGPIHLGTAMNKCLKDFIVKSKTMSGFDAPYVPGWDCHGLPIEIKVDKELGGKKLEMHPTDVRAECRKYAQKFLDLQRQQFKRIGVFGRFDKPYATMTAGYESVVLQTFFSFYENGFVYKGLRAVYWCMHDETALAEAEVEYENHTSSTVWVKYALLDDPAKLDAALAGKKLSTIIWTTTPWTLPASMAVAFHPNEEYVALESGGEAYVVASKLAKDAAEKCGLANPRELAHFPGRKLERLNFQHPFLDRKVLGVLADYVTMDTGTGVVHTAPSHGAEDFATGVKYGLDATSNVDEKGILRNGLPEYDGKRVWDANQPIIDLVRSRGALLHTEKTEHSYPHCWRCHNPVIFRATEQWFISMETPMPGGASKEDTLRTRTLSEIKNVKWDPAWGEERLSNMIQTRPDWCISRQRVWGVPIAVFLCESCGKPLNDHAINRKVVELFARSGADAWFTSESDTIVPAGTKCPHCGGAKFEKEFDIFDVWLESGASYLALVADEPDYYPWPSDLYLEGGDQYRGWFQSSLLCAMGTHATPPYRGVVTPGWTLDEKGQAMSKSRGNDVDPVDIASRLGGEIVRLWTASVDFREDVVGSEALMQRVGENYKKIRNTFRYILGNLDGFDPARDAVAFDELQPLDQYMLRQAAEVSADVQQSYKEFAFHKIYHRINNFCGVELSAFYLDVLKDRLYTSARKSVSRRAAQTAIWRIGEALVRLLAPILSFTCEEVWQYLPPVEGRLESVHLATFPEAKDILGAVVGPDPQQVADWRALLDFRTEVLKRLEEYRNNKIIGGGLEAQLSITASGDLYSILKRYETQLRYLFIVSAVMLEQGSDRTSGATVAVAKADGTKCERCWNYSTHVGEDKNFPTVCERCSAVLKELGVTSPEASGQSDSKAAPTPLRDHYAIGDDLNWDAPWVDVCLWTELPFWLMVDNATIAVECEGHEFPVAVHDNYFELFFGEATDSRRSVGYRGPIKKREELSAAVRKAMERHPEGPYMWRKCKTYLKVGSRCNEDVLNAASRKESPQRVNGAKLYLSDLCRAHIPVINKLIQAYRLATYDYFAFEVSPWDVPHWMIERDGNAISSMLVNYREWDAKPLIFNLKDPTPNEKPRVYKLIDPDELRNRLLPVATPGELELLDALNLMERGDYSGAVRRVTTAIEVVVEDVTGKAMEAANGKQAAEKFIKDTRMRFDERLKTYQKLTGREIPEASLKTLKETRNLRHQIVHGGYRIGPSDRGKAQRAVDSGRWMFNWFENDQARRDVREKRITLRSLGRDLTAGLFRPRITPDGVVLSPIHIP